MALVSKAEADCELIEYARERGRGDVTARKLKRWRGFGVMPPRGRRGLGRGRGIAVSDPNFAKEQLIALCDQLEREPSLWKAALRLWYFGSYVRAGLVQRLVCEAYSSHAELPRRLGLRRRDDAAFAEARYSTRRMSTEDRKLAEKLVPISQGHFRPEDQVAVSARDALTTARADVVERLHGGSASAVDPELFAAMTRLDEFGEVTGDPPGHAAATIAPRVLSRLTDAEIIETVGRLDETALHSIRGLLHAGAAWIKDFRHDPSEPLRRAWAQSVRLTHDPSEPDYSPWALLFAIGAAAVELAELEPDFLAGLEVELAT